MSQLEKTAQAASGRLGRQAAVRNKKARENFMGALFMLCGALTVAFVLGISVYLVVSGLPAIKEVGLWKFLSGSVWDPANTSGGAAFGILPLMLTSVYGTLGASIIGVPVGIMTAVYLAKAAPPRVSAAVRRAVELLAGIPSVVYGLVGMIVLVPWIQSSFGLSSGACLAAAILVLAVMILPSIINVSATALQAVPREYEEASLALGATETETFFRVSLPAARSGVAASVVLGVGRAIGEAMAIIMVSGNVANMPGLFRSVRFLTTAIASGMSYAAYGSLYRNSLFSIGLVLFVFIIILVAIVIVLPLGVGAAVYLTEYSVNRRVSAVIEFAAETLTGIPSIIFGLVGMLFFTQIMGLQEGILAGGLTLVIMILPTVVRTTQESLKSVPQAYREGAMALGAGKWRTVRTVVLPNAVDGIVTGCILAVGRIVGESAALLFTAGFGVELNGFVRSLEASSATLTVALYIYAAERGETGVAFAIAVILMIIALLINFAANRAGKMLNKRRGGM